MRGNFSRPSGHEDPLTLPEETVLTMIVVGQRLARWGKGIPPTLRDMQSWMGYKSPRMMSVHLDRLEAKGYIRRPGRGIARSIEVLR
jgi:SOS-response transcriptional repressor LexA